MKARKERLSIYLAKERIVAHGELINTEAAKLPVRAVLHDSVVTLYAKKDFPRPPPPWTQLFSSALALPEGTFGNSQTVGAVAIIEHGGRVYTLTFGSGHHMLKTDSFERDFGLRVTLASVDSDKLRSVDKASYDDNPLNSRNQSSTEVDIFELQVDSDLEILYALTGASSVPVFGSHVTGRDALTLAVETDLPGILPILDEALRRYLSDLPSEFAWVDNIRRIKDPDIVSVLDSYLDDELAAPANVVLWLGEPEVVDWESQLGYSFDMYSSTPRHVVLRFEALASYLSDHGKSLSTASLRAQAIHINDSDFNSVKSWSAYRCLYAELAVGEERYLLRNGVWFQAMPDFVKQIDEAISRIGSYPHVLPGFSFDREDEYNNSIAKGHSDFSLMDKKNTNLGGRYDKIEFCDLIRGGKDLIHVKYYRSSGTLSHLFAQGFVAAEAFVKDEDFRRKLNDKLPASIRLNDPTARPDARQYNVVFAIATTKSLPAELPFFSKVTLRNALRTLGALGYNVQMARIEVDPAVLAKKHLKPRKSS